MAFDTVKPFLYQAGIKREMLSLAYEPEAAAIYMKEAIVQRKLVTEGCYLSKLEPGQQFMLLDCGGTQLEICYLLYLFKFKQMLLYKIQSSIV